MEVRKLTDQTVIKNIYKTYMQDDFPQDELTPWIYIEDMLQLDQYECYALYEDEDLYGYAFFLKKRVDGKLYYLFDYLAVTEAKRNHGCGTEFLRLLQDCFPDADCILGEVEDPDYGKDDDEKELRLRRIGFYLRNGYYATDVKVCVRGVHYSILEIPTGPSHTKEEVKKIYEEIYKGIAPDWFMKKHFRILE